MVGDQAHRDALAAFLDRQYRQVWAVHRETGERVFIDWGGATPEMRTHAKANLRCPVPGCELRISARGRSKRDHFFHLGKPGHGEGEGEWHLQAKALLAEWANSQDSVVAREEESVLIPASGTLRRADVMATGTGPPWKVALEVEYKHFTPEDWAFKQTDYDSVGVACTWVFGHLPRYLRQPRKPTDHPEEQTWDVLRWVELTETVARPGRPVLFINPVERAVVTAVQHMQPYGDAIRYRDWWQNADTVGIRLAHPDYPIEPVLVLDPLDECRLDPKLGLITPTMARVQQARNQIEEAASKARAEYEARAAAAAVRRQREQEARAREQTRREERQAAQRAAAERARQAAEQAWLDSDLRRHLIERFGGNLPAFLTCTLPTDHGVLASPTIWHGHLYAALVLGAGRRPMVGRVVTIKQVYAMLGAARFPLHPTAKVRASAIREYLQHLHQSGILSVDMDERGTIGEIRVLTDGIDPPPVPAPGPEDNPPASDRAPANAQDANSAETISPSSVAAERWEASMLCKTVRGIWRDGMPDFLRGDDRPHLADAIHAVPEHWHAYIYLKHIHDRRKGHSFTLGEAVDTLVQHGLVRGSSTDAGRAVAAYLQRLCDKHQCLAATPWNDDDHRYYVA